MVPLSSAPTDGFPPLFFHVFLPSCLFILILSFSCAHYRPDLSLYTYTHAYYTYTARFRWPRFVTMRFGSLVVPLHLVPFHGQPHTPLSVLSFSFSSVPFACTCAYLLSGQDGGHTCLPSGRRVCVTLGIIGILLDWSRFCCFELCVTAGGSQADHLGVWLPTKTPICIW